MNVNEFFKAAGATRNQRVICADGFEMSVQAHQSAYCSPRIDNAEKYTSVEIGFPSEREPMLIDFADEPSHPTETVYGYVPVQIVTSYSPSTVVSLRAMYHAAWPRSQR